MMAIHRPVLLKEVIENIKLFKGGIYADLTFGEGGHTEPFLDLGASRVVSVDRDKQTLDRYLEGGKYRSDPRLTLLHTRFSSFPDWAQSQGEAFDGILVDLGVSTRQLLEGQRGFSLREAGPLDMRMDQSEGETLEGYLARVDEEELANALYHNADLVQSRSLARRILKRFHEGRLKSTLDLAAVEPQRERDKSHPATALFMALRMTINQELEEIETTLPRLVPLLKPHGRLVVLTFHSTEDRLVKKIFQLLAGRCICEKKICSCPREKKVELVTRKPLAAGPEELRDNPRARSAKLRCVEKI